MNRRGLFKSLGLGMVAGATGYRSLLSLADAEEVRGQVNTNSEPSKLRITDMRVTRCLRSHVLRLDTNQGISGYGEIRDGASPTYALMLKSRILGENPCHADKVFRKIKQFGGHGRQAGGVPCWQMLGGRFRDRIRMYADTPGTRDPKQMGRRLKECRERGFTFLKMDLGIFILRGQEDALTYPQGTFPFFGGGSVPASLPGIRITEKGLKSLQEYVGTVRDIVGWDIPLAADHFGSIGVEDAIKLAQALDPFNLACLEDMIPWFYTDDYVRIKNSCKTPILTGEDIYLKENFLPLFEKKAISICQPDLATAGGLLETKKIGDLAMEHGIRMAMHMAGTPMALFASVHCAAATENLVVLEHHGVDISYYDDLIKGISKPLMGKDGFVQVPDGPGLGIELNEQVIKENLRWHRQDPDKLFFPPTEEWNRERSHDPQWSRIWPSEERYVG